MRVLFLTSSAPHHEADATSIFILTMARSLQALGHEVTILTPHAVQAARSQYIDGVRFIRFRYAFPARMQMLSSRHGGALPALRKAPWCALLLPFFACAQTFALWRLLRREPFDVIHSHWLLPQGLIGGLLARRFGKAHIAMAHGADVFGLQHRLWLWLKKQALACTHVAVANSQATAAVIRALQPNIPLQVIAVGACQPQEAIKPLATRKAASLLFVGRLFEGKGLAYLLHAVVSLPASATLQIIGDGPDRAALEALAQTLGIADRVHFYGSLPHAQVLEAMQQAQLLIAPSITTADGWREAQGNAIVEAMLRGMAVIASDSGGIVGSIIHEDTGLLVPERDSHALADAIVRLLEDPLLAQRLADTAHAYASEHLSCEASAKKIAALYARVALQQ